jgi:2-keto-4-pentenoate hydratase/2-oxohepta-3-ene-1,7-dioic acid hydratase in catechol pathway
MCIGKNYIDHVEEIAKANNANNQSSSTSIELPKYPVYFTKANSCVIGPNENIESHVNLTKWLDFEAELAIIISKKGRDINKEDALSYVFGYTCANDITARDIQKKHGQWFKGKSLDTTCPLGPSLLLADNEVIKSNQLNIKLRLNGKEMQSSNTKKMIFDIPSIIQSLSQGNLYYIVDSLQFIVYIIFIFYRVYATSW